MPPMPEFRFDNSYARELPGFFVDWSAQAFPEPALRLFNRDLARDLGLDAEALSGEGAAALFSGQTVPEGAHPLAQVYAGHQFGGFSPQLGDGRALLLGEVVTPQGARRDIQFKGSGRTPFSRGGDGKAALGPVLREYLIGEAMHALGIPTTRALAVVTTGEPVYREAALPGAVLTRVAASHIRVGTFQYFAARGEADKVRQLADYAIARHDPALAGAEDRWLRFFDAVAARQARLIAQWMQVGFIHGVMNTDNMTVSGETIDYGPCAFMDTYDPATVFSSIDTGGRYAYGQQPNVAMWNLARFAETLIGLFEDPEAAVEDVTRRLNVFPKLYWAAWLGGMRRKIGLETPDDGDLDLVNDFLDILHERKADYTLAFRHLAGALRGEADAASALPDGPEFEAWSARWHDRAAREDRSAAERAAAMDRVNPLYIPRNHKVEEALAAATEDDDMAPFERLLSVVSRPFGEQPEAEEYARPAPPDFTGGYRTFCGT